MSNFSYYQILEHENIVDHDSHHEVVGKLPQLFIITDVCCRYRDRVTSTNHLATTLLQVKLQPNTYTTGKSTIREEIYSDPVFDGKVEWMTRREGVHHIYGVLVMLKQQHN